MPNSEETEELGLDLEEFDASRGDSEEDDSDRETIELDFDSLE